LIVATRRRSRATGAYQGPRVRMGKYFQRSPDDPTHTWYEQPDPPVFMPYGGYTTVQVCIDEKHGKPPYREGGPLKIISYDLRYDPARVYGGGSIEDRYSTIRYIGGFRPPPDSAFGSAFSDPTAKIQGNPDLGSVNSSFLNARSLGTEGWRRAKPKLELASGFVFLAEMRDIPRMLQTTAQGFKDSWKAIANRSKDDALRVMQPKSAADHFLNHQFGWVPFLGDLQKFSEVLPEMNRHVARISADNGKSVRRRVSLLNTSEYNVISNDVGFDVVGDILPDGLILNCFKAVPSRIITETVDMQAHAVGRFTYYRPEFDSSLPGYNSGWASAQRQLTVLGVRVSPINLYRIIPWSWGIDWVSNVGDYLEYASDVLVDSLVADYFYTTVHCLQTRTVSYSLPFWSGTVNVSFTRRVKAIERVEGDSPFDFNLAWNSLSPRQLSIAAALGLSRRG